MSNATRKPWWIREPPPDPPAAQPALAAKAYDLAALRDDVVDAAGVSARLWLTYLFALFYLLVAAGAVTHQDLLFETPVRLPFLGVDLPLKGFFWLGPALFLIVHAYVLVHFALLAQKVNAFDAELRSQITDPDICTWLRRQLPVNIFVQVLAGPADVRDRFVGLLLWLIAAITLVFGPVALLLFFQLQFLPYHNESITWWQRIAVLIDVGLLGYFWPAMWGRPDVSDSGVIRRLWVKSRHWAGTWGAMVLLGTVSVPLAFAIATFPGESLEQWWQDRVAWIPLRKTLVAGEVDLARRRPTSLWSNRLVLPGLDMLAHFGFDSEAKITAVRETASFRGRHLEDAVLIGAVMRKADFTGAFLTGAYLDDADLRGANFSSEIGPPYYEFTLISAQIQLASLDGAQLQGASFVSAHLEGASLRGAFLQSTSFAGAHLEVANLNRSTLWGASFEAAHLQQTSLARAQLQGATLRLAQLQNASFRRVFVWKTDLWHANTSGARIVNVHTQPTQGCATLSASVICERPETFLLDSVSRIVRGVPQLPYYPESEVLVSGLDQGFAQGEQDMAARWMALQSASPDQTTYESKAAILWQDIGCAADGAPYVLAGLIRNLSWGSPFADDSPEKPRLAAAFLKGDCAGARGLSDADRAKLMELRDRAPAQP